MYPYSLLVSNEDLKRAMNKGTFREDIYYRVNEFKIELIPLRKNKEELADFVQFFLEKSNEELTKTVELVNDDAWQILYDYPWPGNIRELKNTIKRAVLMANINQITLTDLPQEIMSADISEWSGDENLGSKNPAIHSLTLKDVTADAEKTAISKALLLTNNNKTKAAEVLGIDRKTLYNKLNAYGLLEE